MKHYTYVVLLLCSMCLILSSCSESSSLANFSKRKYLKYAPIKKIKKEESINKQSSIEIFALNDDFSPDLIIKNSSSTFKGLFSNTKLDVNTIDESFIMDTVILKNNKIYIGEIISLEKRHIKILYQSNNGRPRKYFAKINRSKIQSYTNHNGINDSRNFYIDNKNSTKIREENYSTYKKPDKKHASTFDWVIFSIITIAIFTLIILSIALTWRYFESRQQNLYGAMFGFLIILSMLKIFMFFYYLFNILGILHDDIMDTLIGIYEAIFSRD